MAAFDFDFLKDRYDFELTRKEAITTALTMPITVVSGVGGLLAAMARTFTYKDQLLWWIFVPIMVSDVISLFGCLIHLARAFHLQTYVYLPLLRELHVAAEEFHDFNSYVEAGSGQVCLRAFFG